MSDPFLSSLVDDISTLSEQQQRADTARTSEAAMLRQIELRQSGADMATIWVGRDTDRPMSVSLHDGYGPGDLANWLIDDALRTHVDDSPEAFVSEVATKAGMDKLRTGQVRDSIEAMAQRLNEMPVDQAMFILHQTFPEAFQPPRRRR